MTYDAKRARAQLEEILARNQKRTRALAGEIADAVLARYKTSSTPTAQLLTEIFREKDVTGRMRKIVGPAVVQSVAAGYGILPSVGFQPPQAAVDLAMSKQWDPKGMPTLSAQLYGTSQAYRLELEDALRKSFAQAKSVQQAARSIYDGYQPGLARTGPFAAVIHSAGTPRPQLPQVIRDGVEAASILDPADKIRLKKYAGAVMAHAEDLKSPALKAAYMRLARQLETSGSRGLDRAVRVATEEKARYHADRIARTESVRAWDASFRARINDDPRVVGIRSRTSSAHKIFDICDFYATADLYGMGPGCYPKDRAPACPYHPHCTCNRTPIYRKRPSEAPPRAGGPDIDAGARALKGMSESDRRQLLGIHGAKAFAANPGSWTGSMRHWSGPGGPDPALAAAKAVVQALPLPEFVPAKSIKEAEQFARTNNLADQVSYTGLHLEAANAINRTLQDHLKRFPQLRPSLQFVGTAQERNRLSWKARKAEGWSDAFLRQAIPRVGSNNLASSTDKRHRQHEGFRGIAFNEITFGREFAFNRDDWKKSQSGVGKFHPPGKDFVTDVTAHELGHQIDALLGLRTDSVVLSLWAEASASGVRSSISGYAVRGGISEGIAEGWAEAFGSDSPRDFAKWLRERILTLLGGSP